MSPTEIGKPQFTYRMTHSIVAGSGDFPFAVSTAIANSPDREREGSNNQDSVSIHVDPEYIIGVVCDGCGSTHPSFELHSNSNNEIGAKLTSSFVVRQLQTKFDPKKKLFPEKIIEKLSKNLLQSFKSTVVAICGRDQDAREKFIFDFLMTTLIGFIITETEFLIFHVGDGVIGVNGNFQDLESEAGKYFGNDLLSTCCPKKYSLKCPLNSIKIYKFGKTAELQSIFIGSDGFSSLVKSNPYELAQFSQTSANGTNCRQGFEFSLQEFRRSISSNADISFNLNDDTAFIMARRLSSK